MMRKVSWSGGSNVFQGLNSHNWWWRVLAAIEYKCGNGVIVWEIYLAESTGCLIPAKLSGVVRSWGTPSFKIYISVCWMDHLTRKRHAYYSLFHSDFLSCRMFRMFALHSERRVREVWMRRDADCVKERNGKCNANFWTWFCFLKNF